MNLPEPLLNDPNVNLRQMDPADRLFRHVKKPEWGVGLWVKEEMTRRRLRFEDGEQRAFKKGFYHMLDSVDPDRVDVDDVYEKIASDHEVAIRDKAEAKARKDKPPVMAFTDQLRVFRAEFPGGFGGDEYRTARRSPDKGRPRKSHLDPAVTLAADVLAKNKLTAALKAEQYDAIHEAAVEVLSLTSLVSPSKTVKPLAALGPDEREAFAKALVDVLYGKDRFRDRFRRWLAALQTGCGLRVDWPFATVFPALVFPNEHVCVKRRPLELQARSIKPGTTIRKRPGRNAYRKARRIARAARKRLEAEGLQPRDLLDVRAFVWETLRPSAQRKLADLKA